MEIKLLQADLEIKDEKIRLLQETIQELQRELASAVGQSSQLTQHHHQQLQDLELNYSIKLEKAKERMEVARRGLVSETEELARRLQEETLLEKRRSEKRSKECRVLRGQLGQLEEENGRLRAAVERVAELEESLRSAKSKLGQANERYRAVEAGTEGWWASWGPRRGWGKS